MSHNLGEIYKIDAKDLFTQTAIFYNTRKITSNPFFFNDIISYKQKALKEKFGWVCELMENEVKKLRIRQQPIRSSEREMLIGSFEALLDLHNDLYKEEKDK